MRAVGSIFIDDLSVSVRHFFSYPFKKCCIVILVAVFFFFFFAIFQMSESGYVENKCNLYSVTKPCQ